MSRFVGELFLFVLIQVAVFGGLIWYGYEPDENSYLAATIDKHELLEKQPSPRLIFVGGSNQAFGLDSAMIARQTPYHPVNMGLFAGFPVDFLLQEVENDLRKGDTVVVILEYEYFRNPVAAMTIPRDLMLLVEARPENLRHFRWPQIKSVLDDGIPLYLRGVVRRAVGTVLGDVPEDSIVYLRASFNAWGDAVAHWGAPSSERYEVSFHLPSEETREPVFRLLNEFHDRCEQRGIFMFVACPPIPRYSYAPVVGGTMGHAIVNRQPDSNLNEFHRILDEQLKAPVITNPAQLLFPVEDFFDSEYHLTREGTRRKTQLLLDGLRPFLGFPEQVPARYWVRPKPKEETPKP